MIGLSVNTITIVVGSILGTLIHKGINEKYREMIMNVVSLIAIALGINWIASNIVNTANPMIFIIILIVGSIIGEIIDINNLIEKFSIKYSKNSNLEGLVTAILLFCVGSLAILGPMNSALENDNTLLFTKAILDGITSFILASNFGIQIIISAPILLLWQGLFYFGAKGLQNLSTENLIIEMSIIGGIILLATGFNILNITKIKTINMIPSLFLVIVYYLIQNLL